MSMNTTYKTYDEVVRYLETVDHPQCFTVNYLPETDEYALWIGNQPYHVYEEWIEEEESKVKELRNENIRLDKVYKNAVIRNLNLHDKVKLMESVIKRIVFPDISEWEEYKQTHGEQVSFQEFLKDIAKGYMGHGK